MNSKNLKRKVAEVEGHLDEISTAQQAIEDRTEFLKQRAKALAYPAHQQGEKQAQKKLNETNAEIQKLVPEYEANDQEIAELNERLAGLQNELKVAITDETIVEHDRMEVIALEKYLEADDLRQETRAAKAEFEELWREVEQLNARIRSMGGHAPGHQPFIQGNDERRRAEVERRIQDLRGSLKVAA